MHIRNANLWAQMACITISWVCGNAKAIDSCIRSDFDLPLQQSFVTQTKLISNHHVFAHKFLHESLASNFVGISAAVQFEP